MRALPALAVVFLCLGGLIGPARAGVDADASKVCVKCHDAEDLPDMSRSEHAVAADARTPGCITCHGASPTHVNKPSGVKERPRPDRVFSKNAGTTASERNAACLACHDKDAKRALWGGSQHDSADVACTSCHKVHTNHDKVLAKATQTEVCFTCHKEQRTQVQRPSHHPIPEGRMSCSDCHNAHGSAGPKLAKRDSTNDTCYTCHAEKRGPFVHPHEPVAEDCANCHNPHGSTVANLLKARAPILCQQCHTPHVAGGVGAVGGQPGVYPPAAPGQFSPAITAVTGGKNVVTIWQGRSCTNCHTQVHGSNNPSATNPTPNFLFR
ncbi:DmsE family decaheme c-type cytochrome [Piscinibacter sp.]|jgi:DmsE family decaheme c-type cytochrome|uniref:DmsE family decaheme c-type cytochrome n=1 Tax=Piscinibacter sp. TaxID=1903157 RepID=UPI002F427117